MEKIEIYQEAVQLLEGEGFEANLIPEYSGRAMYGSTTPAITTEASGARVGWAITAACEGAGLSVFDASKFIPGRCDSMGLGSVYY